MTNPNQPDVAPSDAQPAPTNNVISLNQHRAKTKACTAIPAGLIEDEQRIRCALEAVDAAGENINAAGSAYIFAIKTVGDELIATQAKFKYGEFGPWLRTRTHFKLSVRSANDFMAVSKGWPTIEQKFGSTAAKLSLRAALRLVRSEERKGDKSKRKPKTKTAPTITVEAVLSWLATASQDDKRRVATALASDVAAIRKMLPKKQLPRHAADSSVLKRALGLMVVGHTEQPTA